MFAPPQKIGNQSTRSDAADGGNKQRPGACTKPQIRNRTLSRTYEPDELREWIGACPQTDPVGFDTDDFGIREWSLTLANRKTPIKSPASISANSYRTTSTTTQCGAQCGLLSNNIDHNAGLSDYLKNLKAILARSKSLNAGSSTGAMRFYQGVAQSSPYTSRQNLAFSTPSVPAMVKRRVSPGYRGASQSFPGNSTSTGNLSSQIPCKNYNRLHKHKSYSDLQDCKHQASLDNQAKCYSLSDMHGHSMLPASGNNDNPNDSNAYDIETLHRWQSANKYHSKYINGQTNSFNGNLSRHYVASDAATNALLRSYDESSSSGENGEDSEKTTGTNRLVEETVSSIPSIHQPQNTMQEYVEKYYTPPSRASGNRKALPVIVENEQQRLVENIINYRHTTTRERETIHKNRYLQLTAMDIRRTTAQLLKNSLIRNSLRMNSSEKRSASTPAILTQPYDGEDIRPTPSDGLTFTQLMGSKSSVYRTTPSVERAKLSIASGENGKTQSIIRVSDPMPSVPTVGVRWNVPR